MLLKLIKCYCVFLKKQFAGFVCIKLFNVIFFLPNKETSFINGRNLSKQGKALCLFPTEIPFVIKSASPERAQFVNTGQSPVCSRLKALCLLAAESPCVTICFLNASFASVLPLSTFNLSFSLLLISVIFT